MLAFISFWPSPSPATHTTPLPPSPPPPQQQIIRGRDATFRQAGTKGGAGGTGGLGRVRLAGGATDQGASGGTRREGSTETQPKLGTGGGPCGGGP